MTSVVDGDLVTLNEKVHGAYDEDNERESFFYDDSTGGGPGENRRVIIDYEKGLEYEIQESGKKMTCKVNKITETFQPICVPPESKYIGESTIGDRALTVTTYVYDAAAQGEEEDRVFSVQHLNESECLYVKSWKRGFNNDTGATLSYTHTSFFDIELGIENPDGWFAPPKECKEPVVSSFKQSFTAAKEMMRKMIVL